MSNNAHDKAAQEEDFADIFARLREQDIEQFYAHYQLWVLRRRLPLIENQLEALREHLAENQSATASLHPSALALAVLVRLQSNGVSDTDVLDLMLDRGEDWLDRMMQRLDYCEQVEDFIQGDYTQWCVKSLEGAYDWIDSLLGSIKEDDGQRERPVSGNEATEELLLQKLRQDDEETLDVTLKQPVTQVESAPASYETTTAPSLSANEHEQTTLPEEQISTPYEKNEPASQPELILQSNEVGEPQESSEIEEQPELIGWKDLEDLEAPGEQPVPWYSVDVTEDGTTASSASNGSKQAATMNDWIKILQVEHTPNIEASETETVTDSATELRSTTEMEETAETYASALLPEIATTETPGEMTNAPADNAEVAEQERSSEIQNGLETIAPAHTNQEQDALLSAELSTEKIGSSESEILADETPATAISLAEENALLDEKRASESDDGESKLPSGEVDLAQGAVTESSHDAHKANAIAVSAEQTQEEAGQFAGESVDRLEEPEHVTNEQEAVQTLAEEGVTGTDEAESYQSPPSTGNLAQAEVKETEIAEVLQPFADNVEQTEAAEAQSTTIDLAPPASAPAELPEAQIFAKETSETEQTSDQHPQSPQPHAEEVPLNTNDLGEQPERPEAERAPEAEKEARSKQIETTTSANDIFNEEEEQEGQLAWYEYLDLEEPANNVVNSAPGERSEREKSEDISSNELYASETSTPEIAEYAEVDEQNSVLRPQDKSTEEASESEDWQSWNASEADQETLPLALKEIQQAQQPLVSDTPENVTSEVVEPRDALANEEAETPAPATIVEDSNATARMAYTASEKLPASKALDITEQPTLMMDKLPQVPRASVTDGTPKGSASVNPVVQIRNTPVSAQLAQPEKVEQPPKKLGFWRRLFSFGRKKQK